MFESNDFIFLHLPKCAGTYIQNVLKDNLLGKISKKNHKTIRIYDKNRPKIIGSVRNPFSYYVSNWSYSCQMKGEPFRLFIEERPDKINLFKDPNNVKNFKEWFNILHYEIDLDAPSLGITRKPNTSYRQQNVGYYTFTFFKMYNELKFELLKTPEKDILVNEFIKVETIDEDLKRIFSIQINNREKMNTSEHLDYHEYYDEELKEKVFILDKYIFNKFNYTF